MNFIKKSLIIILLLISLIYTVNITSMPKNVILLENEELDLKQVLGITLKESKKEVLQTSNDSNKIETKTISVSLFNLFNVKEVNVSTVKNTKVVPLGNIIGIKLYSNGVLVIGMTEVEGKKPYENTGIKEGDLITTVDNVTVTTTEELIKCVNNSQGKLVKIKYIREGTEYVTDIEPVKTKEDKYKIGLWVRDGACGIGTATYYDPGTGKIATLGHGIVDRDTDKLITIESGKLLTSTITKIKKGEKGNPGEIKGIINDNQTIGSINLNTDFGIYGNLKEINTLGIDKNNSLDIALKNEIKTGEATILLALEDEIRKEYKIEITDEKLIEKTGGIIQGMSGAPIIQNGKFIGAITHVLVNNPLQGYAVFGEIMIKQMNI